ncbi:NBAS subunit of NRZ tethering complex-like [Ciona intestinalis]
MGQHSPGGRGGGFYNENKELTQFRGPIDDVIATQWYTYRAKHLDAEARQLEHAVHLINFGLKLGFSKLQSLHTMLGLLYNLIFECGCDLAVTLDELEGMEATQHVDMLLCNSTELSVISDIQRWVTPYIDTLDDKTLISNYLLNISRTNIKMTRVVVRHVLMSNDVEAFFDNEVDFVDVVVSCVHAMLDNQQLNVALDIIGICLVKISSMTSLKKLKETKVLLESLKTLSTRCFHLNPEKLFSIRGDRHQISMLFKAFFTKSVADAQLTLAKCKDILAQGLGVRGSMFGEYDEVECLETFVRCLLSVGSEDGVRMSGCFMNQRASDNYKGKLPYKDSVALVVSASNEYLDSISIDSKENKMLRLSKVCLGLIEEQTSVISCQSNFIEAVEVLQNMGLEIVPIKIRLCKDKIEIIKQALEKQSSYVNMISILRLGELLQDKYLNERTKLLVIEQALKNNDHILAKQLTLNLMEENFSQVSTICYELGVSGNLDPEFRYHCLAFAASHCPNNHLYDIIVATKSLLSEHFRHLLQPIPSFEVTGIVYENKSFIETSSGQNETGQNEPEFYQSIVGGEVPYKTVNHYTGYDTNPYVNNIMRRIIHQPTTINIDILLQTDFKLGLFYILSQEFNVSFPTN